MTPLEKFQELLRELFQLKDAAELDFGIYRILNLKRTQVEEFISDRLPAIVEEAFAQYASANIAGARDRLAKLRAEYLSLAGEAAFLPNGELVPNLRDKEKGQEYSSLLADVRSAAVTDELKARVYNDLYNFFCRYYEDGDFITRRRIRYSGQEAYAVPYNGDEVMLHWATKDQYYVKTIDRFTSYRFHAGDYTVSFEVRRAEVDEGNGRDKKRYYALAAAEPLYWDADKKTFGVYFDYRPLTSGEQKDYGKTEQQKPQKGLNEATARAILDGATEAGLKAQLARSESADADVSLLARHLTRFTRRNTSDFFIHKNLRGFLEQELDYFLKSECLLLDELVNTEDPKLPQAHVLRARVVRRIAGHIIDFLAQVEDFQKRLFEKRKFVLRSEYCLTLDRVPEEFWTEVLANEAQVAEWRDLFALDDLLKAEKKRKLDHAFLKAHPTLVIDTKHFSEDFKWRLLASFANLDELTDGILIHGDNLQALNQLQDKFRERVACIHIDPPYNTQTTGFLYKNSYQHSSWLAMMADRLLASRALLSHEASLLCHIDENEYERLKLCLDRIGIPDAGTVVWDKRNPMTAGQGVATQHEYIAWRSAIDRPISQPNGNSRMMLRAAATIIAKHGGVTEAARTEYAVWVRTNPRLSGGEKAYRFLDDAGKVYQSVSLRAPEPRTDPKFFEPLVHPVTGKPCKVPPNGFSRTPETLRNMVERGEILFGADESTQPRQKCPLDEETQMQVRSVIQDAKRGKDDLEPMGFDFPYCHPVSLYRLLVGAGAPENGDWVFDYFAGSGTTGHAVISLNREDGVQRKLMLVEIGGYFDTVLLPRLKKVTFTPEWKDGKPRRQATSEETERGPRIIKYHTIESYEDALENISIMASDAAQSALKLYGDDYLLKYGLDLETRGSESLLTADMFKDPFGYKLKVRVENGKQESAVDLVETFDYLLGLDVRRMRQFDDNGRVYRAVLGDKRGKNIVVVWRSVKDIEERKDALLTDRAFIEKTILPTLLPDGAKPDRLFVNGASFVKDAEAIEPEFKRLMFAPLS